MSFSDNLSLHLIFLIDLDVCLSDDNDQVNIVRGDVRNDEEEGFISLIHNYLFTNARASGGSSVGRCKTCARDYESGNQRLLNDYFGSSPVYDDLLFRRSFRMRRPLFLFLVQGVEDNDNYFRQQPDATGKLGLSAIQKVTAALRQLAYRSLADAVDEYICSSESTAIES